MISMVAYDRLVASGRAGMAVVCLLITRTRLFPV